MNNQFIFIDMKTNQITVARGIDNALTTTATVFLGPKHPGMVFTSLYLGANTCDYEVYTGGPLVAERIKELAEGIPAHVKTGRKKSGKPGVPDEIVEIEIDAVPGNLQAALDYARAAGALVGKLVVSVPKVDG